MRKTKAKKIEARKRIKKHVRRRGEACDFELTHEFVLYWWHRLNEAVFDGMLTPPAKIELRAFRDSAGWCIPHDMRRKERRVKIGISTDIWERKTFLIVLAHEMVHQWEWEVLADWNPRVNHGKTFYSWTWKLKDRAGLPLTEHVDI